MNQGDTQKPGSVRELLLQACRDLPATCQARCQLAGLFLQKGMLLEGETLLLMSLRLPSDQATTAALELLGRLWRETGHERAGQYLQERAASQGRDHGGGGGAGGAEDVLALGLLLRNYGRDVEALLSAPPGRRALGLAGVYLRLGALELVEHYCERALAAGCEAEAVAGLRAFARAVWARPAWPVPGQPPPPCWDENRPLLAEHFPHLAALVESRRGDADKFRVLSLAGGWLQALEPGDGWLNGSYTWWEDLAELLLQPPRYDFAQRTTEAILINGLHLGAELEVLFRASQGAADRPGIPIYVLEPRPEVLALYFSLRPIREMLASGRVFFFAGPGALEDLWRFLAQRPGLKRPRTIYPQPGRGGRGGWEHSRLVGFLNQRIAEWEAPLWAEVERIHSWYARRSAERWRRLLSGRGDRPLRVVFLTSRFTAFARYSVRDCAAACRELGCRTMVVMEEDDLGAVGLHQMVEALAFKPDLFFTINYPSSRLGRLRPPQVPFVTWVQDAWSPVLREPPLNPNDFILSQFNPNHYPRRCRLRAQYRCNPKIYHPVELSARDRERYACQVSYVSHRSRLGAREGERLLEQVKGRFGPSSAEAVFTGRALEALDRRYQQGGAVYSVDELLELAGGDDLAENIRLALAEELFQEVNDLYYRQQVLQWLARAGVDLHLWGRGWERHPELGDFARGVIENGEELNKLFNASAVNLHVSCHGGVHHRILDAAAAGGFFLLRHHPITDRVPWLLACLSRLAGEQNDLAGLMAACPDEQARYYLLKSLRRLELPPGKDAFAEIRDWLDQKYRRLQGEENPLVNISLLFPRLPEMSFAGRDDLLERLGRLLDDPGRRRELAREARQRVLEFATHRRLMERMFAHLARNYQPLS